MKRNKKPEHLYPRRAGIKKYSSGNKTIVVMPSPVVKKDLTDYAYAKDIDEKVVKLAMKLAEKMAVSMVRETLKQNKNELTSSAIDLTVDKIVQQLEKKMPAQQTIIREVAAESASTAKQEVANFDLDFTGPTINVDRTDGLEVKGKIGKKVTSKDDLDSQLDAIEDFNF